MQVFTLSPTALDMQIILFFLQNKSCFVFCFLDSRHSIYFRIILRSALTGSGSSASPLGCTWLSELPLSLISTYVCLCHCSVWFIHGHSLEKHSICKYTTCKSWLLTWQNLSSCLQPACLICINGSLGSTLKLMDSEGRAEEFER